MTNGEAKNIQAEEVADLSAEERIAKIRRPRWIGYPRAIEILNHMEELLAHPKIHRMPNMLLVGHTNNGKTMLVNRFTMKYPAHDNPRGNGIVVPVLSIQAPPVPDENRFYNLILEKLYAPFKPRDHVSKKQMQVLGTMRRINVGMLVIDEIHHILAGHIEKQRQFLNVIKYMGNELQIPIIGVGTKDAFRAIQTDPQLSNRFEPEVLPKWQLNMDFLKLLASFEKMLPLQKPSRLTETSMAARLLSMSEGTIGELSNLLNKAAIHAIRSKTECITNKVLDEVNWASPSERKKRANLVV
ncbi:transposition ATP-binding protein TniB [Syntrophotalea carbinolica DSM 2380]|uniref:Transposition ATP-binding protein TniB n=1 Tax=Syntrophotalea carbinolica (strain DSM 2380 / NBRC 103641 / GraBd1) TaxID=338963 RepID=Q3A8A6_SYNC1|nr:TniB family NTP-binding protein [Syntrophotalea carbinolica]ABA87386.1 transposition ATP-binding protein TniB [Syntrophotalea carbinolica DSM 2380]